MFLKMIAFQIIKYKLKIKKEILLYFDKGFLLP